MEVGWHPTFIFLVGPANTPFKYCIGLAMNSSFILNFKFEIRLTPERLPSVYSTVLKFQ